MCLEETLEKKCPLRILVPHSSQLERNVEGDDDAEFRAWSQAATAGFDAVIPATPDSWKLACEVQSAIAKTQKRFAHFKKVLQEHRESVEYGEEVKELVHHTVWDYFRARTSDIPPPDYELGAMVTGQKIGGFEVGQKLGEGGNGTVYMLKDPVCMDGSIGQVVKVIPKDPASSLARFKAIDKGLKCMKALSSSTWQHPNIVKLLDVYHSATHLALRMEDGGLHDLFGYLKKRETKQFPLGTKKVTSIIMQAKDALCHMHLGPRIVHRDIKAENILAHETQDGIRIKLCDFDLARIVSKHSLCQGMVGSYPFMAPEIMSGKPYDLFAADVWAMGSVFLEVLCRPSVVSGVVHNGCMPTDRDGIVAMTRTISKFFKQPSFLPNMLESHIRPELKDSLLASTDKLLRGMLSVNVSLRWTAKELDAVTHVWKVDRKKVTHLVVQAV
jgi:serine/threonine protein kinase